MLVLTMAFWALAIGCYFYMRRIEPECSTLYLVYVVLVCGIFTYYWNFAVHP